MGEDIEDIVDDAETASKLSKIIEQKVEQKVEERLRRSQDQKKKSGRKTLSRRGFLKKLGLGAAGIGAAAIVPSASAYNVRSDDALEVFSDGTKRFDIDPNGPVNINNADLELNGNPITDSTGTVSIAAELEASRVKVGEALFHAKSLGSGKTVNIGPDEGVVVSGNYQVDGTLNIEQGGSLSVV